MSDFNYCHGPNCHTYHTQSRIRGVKGNKVLRTRKVTNSHAWRGGQWGTQWWHYFCDERCRTDYMHKHLQAIMNLEPRNEPLETPVDIVKEEVDSYWGKRVEITINERT